MLRVGFRGGMLLLALTIFALQTRAVPAADQEETEREIALEKVPAKAKATILKAAGKNEVTEVEEVILTLFEVEWRKGDKEIEIFLTPDGEVLMKKIEKEGDDDAEDADEDEEGKDEKESAEEDDGEIDEKEISMEDLPAKVKATVKKLAGKNEIELEEVRMKFYEAEWLQKDKEIEILVAADGSVVKTNGAKPEKDLKARTKAKKERGNKDDDEKEGND